MDGPGLGAPPGTTGVISIFDSTGYVVASAPHAQRTDLTSQGRLSSPLPYVSVSGTHVYFLDGDATVRSLDLAGIVRTVTSVPGTPTAHAAFAVSPDDLKMAVSVIDYQTDPPTVHLLVQDLGGANRHEIFSSRSLVVWPVGWRAGKLVVGSGPAYYNFPGFNLSGPVTEYHVIDPDTADRLATLGSSTSCPIISPVTRGGAVCDSSSTDCYECLNAVEWTGKMVAFTPPGSFYQIAGLSPDGTRMVTLLEPEVAVLIINSPAAGGMVTRMPGDHSQWIMGWFDSGHIVIGVGSQALIVDAADVTRRQTIDAPGRFVGSFPNDLG